MGFADGLFIGMFVCLLDTRVNVCFVCFVCLAKRRFYDLRRSAVTALLNGGITRKQ